MCNTTWQGRGIGGCIYRVNGSGRVRNGYMVKKLHSAQLGVYCRISPVTLQKLFWIQKDGNDPTPNNPHFALRAHIWWSVSYLLVLSRCFGYSGHPSLLPVLISGRLGLTAQPTTWLEKESPRCHHSYKMNRLL